MATATQLTMSFEPCLPERFATLREYVAHRVNVQTKPAKTIAADMDLSPSSLSRKLTPGDGDTARFNLDDLERYLAVTGDVLPVVEYLLAKYAPGAEEDRRTRALERVGDLLQGLPDLLAAAGLQPNGKAVRR